MIEVAALKAFPQFTREYIRNGISYINLIGLLETIVPYRTGDEKKKKKITHFEQFNF